MQRVYAKPKRRGRHLALGPTRKVKPCCEEEDRRLGDFIQRVAIKKKRLAAEMCTFGPHKDSDSSPVDEPPVWETALAF